MATANKKTETGKNGLWDTRPNPFANKASVAAKVSLGDVRSLGMAFDKVLAEGCAIMLGKTRDGGALVLTILDGEQRHRTYCASQSDLDNAIEALDFVYNSD